MTDTSTALTPVAEPAPLPVAQETAPPPAPVVTEEEEQGLSQAQKASIIIAALGPDIAVRLMDGMSESSIQNFAEAITDMRAIERPLVEETIEEFLGVLGGPESVAGGAAQARRILSRVLDVDSTARIMEQVEGPSGRTIWEKLSNCSDASVANFLMNEHPQTAAVVISKLRSDKAARVIERFAPGFSRDVILRLGRVHRLDSSVMDEVKAILYRDFLGTLRREQATRKPADVIGSMLNYVSSDPRGELLGHLQDTKPDLAQEVERVMFTFPDIAVRVNPREIATILKEVDNQTLMTAMKTARSTTPRVIEFILSNISKRMGEQIEEEMENLPPIKASDGELAQSEVIRVIQELAGSGAITLIEPDGDEAMI